MIGLLTGCGQPIGAGSPVVSTVVSETGSSSPPPVDTASETTAPAAVPPGTAVAVDTGDVTGFEIGEILIDDQTLVVAIADDGGLRGRGLRGVTDFGDLAGMLFTWDGEVVDAAFTMKDTLVPLDVAFFGADGRLVDNFLMTPCQAAPCAVYQPSGEYAYAVERPAGAFTHLPATAVLVVGG